MATKTIEADFTVERESVPSTAIARAEIDTQIATAKQYPRALDKFNQKAEAMVEAHMALAKKPEEGLNYALPRGGKIIEGPNARFAEIVAYCWGNMRISRDMISEENRHVICESICHDLETNNAERVRVRRRITNRDGIRYDDDMITVTANAGASIARRNGVLAVIPKAQWWPLYQRALKLAGGETKKEISHEARKALEHFAKIGISEAQVLAVLKTKKTSDLTSAHVATLRGIAAAIVNGETTAAKAFGGKDDEPKGKRSQIKEEKTDDKITDSQVKDVYTLMSDLRLESTELAKLLASIGHKGKLPTLPKAKLAELHEKIQGAKK